MLGLAAHAMLSRLTKSFDLFTKTPSHKGHRGQARNALGSLCHCVLLSRFRCRIDQPSESHPTAPRV